VLRRFTSSGEMPRHERTRRVHRLARFKGTGWRVQGACNDCAYGLVRVQRLARVQGACNDSLACKMASAAKGHAHMTPELLAARGIAPLPCARSGSV
jgi:hypothetical protein